MLIKRIACLFMYNTTDNVYNENEFWALRDKALSGAGGGKKNRILEYRLKCFNRAFGCSVPITEKINKFVTPHGLYGIFISEGASIGENCIIYQGVTIGSNTLVDSKRAGAPYIGDNVFIGAGAIIIGNVTIGNNVRIGANCIVTEDVPDNASVVMNKPEVILHSDARENVYIPWGVYKNRKVL